MEKNLFAVMAQYPGQVLYVTPSGIYNQMPISEPLLGIVAPIQQGSKIDFVTSESSLIQKGWYRYEDRTFSQEPDSTKKITGIVRLIDRTAPLGQQIKSIGLKEEKMPWSSIFYTFGAYDDKDGQKNTDLIAKVAYAQSTKTAAAWCKAQDGYLEAKDTLTLMLSGDEELNLPFEKIGTTPISRDDVYLTSTEGTVNYYAWVLRPSDGNLDWRNKTNRTYRVRCTFSD